MLCDSAAWGGGFTGKSTGGGERLGLRRGCTRQAFSRLDSKNR